MLGGRAPTIQAWPAISFGGNFVALVGVEGHDVR